MRLTIFPASCGSRRRAAPQLRRQIDTVEQPKFTSTPKKTFRFDAGGSGRHAFGSDP